MLNLCTSCSQKAKIELGSLYTQGLVTVHCWCTKKQIFTNNVQPLLYFHLRMTTTQSKKQKTIAKLSHAYSADWTPLLNQSTKKLAAHFWIFIENNCLASFIIQSWLSLITTEKKVINVDRLRCNHREYTRHQLSCFSFNLRHESHP